MNVLALTIFVSVILAAMFTLLWLATAASPRPFSERDALLPLEEDAPPASTPAPSSFDKNS